MADVTSKWIRKDCAAFPPTDSSAELWMDAWLELPRERTGRSEESGARCYRRHNRWIVRQSAPNEQRIALCLHLNRGCRSPVHGFHFSNRFSRSNRFDALVRDNIDPLNGSSVGQRILADPQIVDQKSRAIHDGTQLILHVIGKETAILREALSIALT